MMTMYHFLMKIKLTKETKMAKKSVKTVIDPSKEIKALENKIKALKAKNPSPEDEFFKICELLSTNKEFRKLRNALYDSQDVLYKVPIQLDIEFYLDMDGKPEFNPDSAIDFIDNIWSSRKLRGSPEFKAALENARVDREAIETRVFEFIEKFLVGFEPKKIKINKSTILRIKNYLGC